MVADDNGKLLLGNSLRLLSDARFLLDDGRYPSAAALAILSLEEFGKFITAIGFLANPSLDKRLHIKKQSDTSLFILRFSYALAIADHFDIHVDLSDVTKKTIILESEYAEMFENYMYIRSAYMDMKHFEKIISSDLMARAMRLFALVNNNDLNLIKNKALYVDVYSDGSIKSPEIEISAEKAQELVDLCDYVISFFNERILLNAKVNE